MDETEAEISRNEGIMRFIEEGKREKELTTDNRRKAREMRLNDFPVDSAEIAGLKDWIKKQSFKPWPPK
jgi:hypothetical protein